MSMKSLRYVDHKQSTLKDPKRVKRELARLAAKWGMTIKECIEYMLRMGLNRCLALERHNRLKTKASKKKRANPVKKNAKVKKS